MRIAIIGGGPGGYVAAIRAAQLGGEVTLIEKDAVGGTCVNRGCIPTKALLKGVDPVIEFKKFQSMGLLATLEGMDIDKLRSHAKKSILLSKSGIEYLLKQNSVRYIQGEAIRNDNKTILGNDSQQQPFAIPYDKLILALGSVPSTIPGIVPDGSLIMTSDEALPLQTIPPTLLIIGGGVIGVEMATIYAALGTKVTVVEMMEQILPGEDPECVQVLHQQLQKIGIQIKTGCKVEKVEKTASSCKACLHYQNETITGDFSQILVATGRKPFIQETLLSSLSIPFSPKGVQSNQWTETENPDIYVIGDLNGVSMLAHTASTEGKLACARIFQQTAHPMQYAWMPRCVYTLPELASVGETNRGHTFVFPYSANGRARAAAIREGKIKLFVEDQHLIGCTIVGQNASDMITMATIAISQQLSLDQLETVTFPHPTYSEVFLDALEMAIGKPIHFA